MKMIAKPCTTLFVTATLASIAMLDENETDARRQNGSNDVGDNFHAFSYFLNDSFARGFFNSFHLLMNHHARLPVLPNKTYLFIMTMLFGRVNYHFPRPSLTQSPISQVTRFFSHNAYNG